MTEEKRNRLVAAFTVNAILLLVILLAVVIYQYVNIAMLSERQTALNSQIEQLEQATQQGLDKLQLLQNEDYLAYLAGNYGWGVQP